MNKCVTCGKFKKWTEMKGHFIPDSHFGPEESWYECYDCIKAALSATEDEKV